MVHLHDLDSNKVTHQGAWCHEIRKSHSFLLPSYAAARMCPTSPLPDMGFWWWQKASREPAMPGLIWKCRNQRELDWASHLKDMRCHLSPSTTQERSQTPGSILPT